MVGSGTDPVEEKLTGTKRLWEEHKRKESEKSRSIANSKASRYSNRTSVTVRTRSNKPTKSKSADAVRKMEENKLGTGLLGTKTDIKPAVEDKVATERRLKTQDTNISLATGELLVAHKEEMGTKEGLVPKVEFVPNTQDVTRPTATATQSSDSAIMKSDTREIIAEFKKEMDLTMKEHVDGLHRELINITSRVESNFVKKSSFEVLQDEVSQLMLTGIRPRPTATEENHPGE